MNKQLKLEVADVPEIRSQTAYVYLSSLQKKKNPDVFQFKSTIQVSTYEFNPSLFDTTKTQPIISGRTQRSAAVKGRDRHVIEFVFD